MLESLASGPHPPTGSNLAFVVFGIVVALIASAAQLRPETGRSRRDLSADVLWALAASLLVLGVVPSRWYPLAFSTLAVVILARGVWYFRSRRRGDGKRLADRPGRPNTYADVVPKRPRAGRSRRPKTVDDWLHVPRGDSEFDQRGGPGQAGLTDLLGPVPPDEGGRGNTNPR